MQRIRQEFEFDANGQIAIPSPCKNSAPWVFDKPQVWINQVSSNFDNPGKVVLVFEHQSQDYIAEIEIEEVADDDVEEPRYLVKQIRRSHDNAFMVPMYLIDEVDEEERARYLHQFDHLLKHIRTTVSVFEALDKT